MILAALDTLTQVALPLIAQGSQNIFNLKAPHLHQFHPFQRKKINSGLKLTPPSSSDAFIGCLNDKLKDPLKLMTKYILPGSLGTQIMFDIFNCSQTKHELKPGDQVCSLGVSGCANNGFENYTQKIYPLQQIQLYGQTSMDVQTNISTSYPSIFVNVQTQNFTTASHLNSSVVTIKNLTDYKIKISTSTLLGQSVSLFFNASDQPTINQVKPTALNVNTISQAFKGIKHQLSMPFDLFDSSSQKNHILPFNVQGLLNSPNSSGRKNNAANYQRIMLIKDTAFNLLNGFAQKQTFKSDWSAAQNELTTQIDDEPHSRKKQKQKQHHKHKKGLLGLIFEPITAITSLLFISKKYKVNKEQFQIQLIHHCKTIKITGEVEAKYQNKKLQIKSFQQQIILIQFLY